MNNKDKNQLVVLLESAINKINDNDIKIELGKILDKVNDNQELDNYDVSYVADNAFIAVGEPEDENGKKESIIRVCNKYNESLRNSLSKRNSLSNSDSDNDSDNDNDSDSDNVNADEEDEVDEIDRIEARIDEIAEIEKEFVSMNMELLKNNIPSKIDGFNLSDSEKEEKKNKLSSITDSDALGNFINDNFNGEDKDKLFIELLNNRINDIDTRQTSIEKSFEVNDNNRKIIASGLSVYFLSLSNSSKNLSNEEKNNYSNIATDLRHRKGNITIDEINELISKYSINKEELFLLSFKHEKNEFIKSYKLENLEVKVGDKKAIERIEELTDKLQKMSNNNSTSDEQEKCVDELKKLYENLNIYNDDYSDRIRNAKYNDIDFFVKIFNDVKDHYNQLLSYKDDIDKYIDNTSKNKDEYKKNIKELSKLKDFELIFNERNDLRNITLLFDKIRKEIVDDLKNDEDFKNLKRKEKLKEISNLVDNNNDYNRMISYPDNLINKEKLTKELKKKIAKDLKIKKKKKVKIENNKKKWYKSIAFWGGAALGVGLSFAVVPGTTGLILSGARLAYSFGKKFIKSYAKKHEGENTGLMRVINKVTDVKDKFKEKHPRITAAVSKVNNFFKKPDVQYFMNGVAVGYTVGKIGQSVANIFDNGPGTNPSGDTGGKPTPETPEPTVADPASDKVADVSDAVDKVAKGQRWDISGVDNGYGFDSSTMDNRVHLNQDLAENVKIVKTKVVDGVKMVLTKSTDGDKFAWFKADDILEQGEVLKAVGRSK